MKKTIVCFGDSNTYGYIPGEGGRYPRERCWPYVLQALLGEYYEVVSEGFNGRTIDREDPRLKWKRADLYLPACIASHTPMDLLIIMLGTNDLKSCYKKSAEEIALSAGNLVRLAQQVSMERESNGKAAKILLVSPNHVHPDIANTEFGEEFGRTEGYEKSKLLSKLYRIQAQNCGVYFLDAALYAEPSPIDGIHMDDHGHKHLAAAISKIITDLM